MELRLPPENRDGIPPGDHVFRMKVIVGDLNTMVTSLRALQHK